MSAGNANSRTCTIALCPHGQPLILNGRESFVPEEQDTVHAARVCLWSVAECAVMWVSTPRSLMEVSRALVGDGAGVV